MRLLEPDAVGKAAAAFATFCAVSGVMYIVNDVMDREADGRHPAKCRRPIASGALSVSVALGVAAGLGALALGASVAIGWPRERI